MTDSSYIVLVILFTAIDFVTGLKQETNDI